MGGTCSVASIDGRAGGLCRVAVSSRPSHEQRQSDHCGPAAQPKPFNDVHGDTRGDELILACARSIQRHLDPDLDFLGHVGGDDFVAVLRSEDWEARLQRVLEEFEASIRPLFSVHQLAEGGYVGVDRNGRQVFHPLTSLSIGVLPVQPGTFERYADIAATVAECKAQAKRLPGNSCFVDRRRYRSASASVERDDHRRVVGGLGALAQLPFDDTGAYPRAQ